MFSFLKKIFQSQEQESKKTKEISLSSIEEWLNESSKPLMEQIQQQAEETLMKVNEELQVARLNVEVLENAKLQNPNIPFKAKQYMEGNRKAYTRAVSSFLGQMKINNKDYFYLLDFCKSFDEMINELNKGTFRSYAILQEFFANEAGNIAKNLKNFDTLFKELKSILNNEKIVAVNNARDKIQSLKSKVSQKINIDVDFKSIETNIKLASDEKGSLMAKIEEFSKSDEHSSFLKLNDEKKARANAFYNDESMILQGFSVLDRALRKYSHIAFEHEETILDYLRQPIDALANDKNLEILQILENLQNLINENKLQIDEKKKEKSIEEIKKLNKEFLEQFLRKYFSFKAEIEGIESRIKASGVPEKLRAFNRQLADANSRIEKCSEELKKLQHDASKLSSVIENLRNEIEKDIQDIFGEEVKIKNPTHTHS